MKFDVVICTKNSARTLDACLSALKRSDIPFNKIYVIDRNSKDGTKEIAEKHGCIYVSNDLNCAEARIYGAKLAETEYFINLDSDIVVAPYFYRALKRYVEAGFKIVKGIYINVLPECHTKIAFRDFVWMHKNIGGLDCCIIHRQTFLELSKYFTNLDAGEDTKLYELCRQNKIPVHQDVGVISFHMVGSVARILKQTSWYGKSARKGKLPPKGFKNHAFLPFIMLLGLPILGLVEMFVYKSWKLLFYEVAKAMFWFKGFLTP